MESVESVVGAQIHSRQVRNFRCRLSADFLSGATCETGPLPVGSEVPPGGQGRNMQLVSAAAECLRVGENL